MKESLFFAMKTCQCVRSVVFFLREHPTCNTYTLHRTQVHSQKPYSYPPVHPVRIAIAAPSEGVDRLPTPTNCDILAGFTRYNPHQRRCKWWLHCVTPAPDTWLVEVNPMLTCNNTMQSLSSLSAACIALG